MLTHARRPFVSRGAHRWLPVLALTAVAALYAATSSASACGPSDHCAALGTGSTPGGNHGVEVGLCKTKLWIPDWQSDHINRSVCLYFGNYWTEAGMANGLYAYNDASSPTFYWADDNTQYGYSEHFASYGPTSGDIYGAHITLRGQPWWDVSVANYTYGYGSWHNTSEATSMYTGVEFTNPNSGYQSDSGASHTLYYYDNSGGRVQGWPNAGVSVNTSLATGFWYQHYWWWADRTWDQPWTC